MHLSSAYNICQQMTKKENFKVISFIIIIIIIITYKVPHATVTDIFIFIANSHVYLISKLRLILDSEISSKLRFNVFF